MVSLKFIFSKTLLILILFSITSPEVQSEEEWTTYYRKKDFNFYHSIFLNNSYLSFEIFTVCEHLLCRPTNFDFMIVFTSVASTNGGSFNFSFSRLQRTKRRFTQNKMDYILREIQNVSLFCNPHFLTNRLLTNPGKLVINLGRDRIEFKKTKIFRNLYINQIFNLNTEGITRKPSWNRHFTKQ